MGIGSKDGIPASQKTWTLSGSSFFSCSLFESCAVTQPGYCIIGTPTCCVIGTRGNGTTGSDCNQLGVYMLGTVCVLVCGIIIEGISIGRYQYNSTFFLWHLMIMYA